MADDETIREFAIQIDQDQILAAIQKLPEFLQKEILESLDGADDFWRFFEIATPDPLSTFGADADGPVVIAEIRLKQPMISASGTDGGQS
jgi:hypothetical protein